MECLPEAKILKILQKLENTPNIVIESVDVKPGSSAGDNFTGILTAMHVTARVDDRAKIFKWIVKRPNTDDQSKLMLMRQLNSELCENTFYTKFIPEMKKYLECKGVTDIDLNFCPDIHAEYYEDMTKGSLTIMENLK